MRAVAHRGRNLGFYCRRFYKTTNKERQKRFPTGAVFVFNAAYLMQKQTHFGLPVRCGDDSLTALERRSTKGEFWFRIEPE